MREIATSSFVKSALPGYRRVEVADRAGMADISPGCVQALEARVKLLEQVIDNFPGGLLLFNEKLELVICNKRQRELLEYPDSLFLDGPPTLEQLFEYNARRGEYGPGDVSEHVANRVDLARQRSAHVFERTRPNGTVLEVRGTPLEGGGFVTTYLDVTEQRSNHNLIAHMAHHDLLTDLPNRKLLKDRLDVATARVERGDNLALLYIDLDRFKPVNDRFGHAVGDLLLKEVADRLREATRKVDTVARVGGDEFIIILAGIQNVANAEIGVRRILHSIEQPFMIDGHVIELGASIGISMSPDDAVKPDDLMKSADAAMYHAKQSRCRHYTFFSSIRRGDAAASARKNR